MLNKMQKQAWEKLQVASPALVVPNEEADPYHDLVRLHKAWVYESNDQTTTFVAWWDVEEVVVGNQSVVRQGPKSDPWRWHNGNCTIAKIYLDETRERLEDWSGEKQFRVIYHQEVTIQVRTPYGEHELDFTFYGGEKTVLRQIIEYGPHWLWQQLYHELRHQARQVTDPLTVMNAESRVFRTERDDEERQYQELCTQISRVISENQKESL